MSREFHFLFANLHSNEPWRFVNGPSSALKGGKLTLLARPESSTQIPPPELEVISSRCLLRVLGVFDYFWLKFSVNLCDSVYIFNFSHFVEYARDTEIILSSKRNNLQRGDTLNYNSRDFGAKDSVEKFKYFYFQRVK